ncbi:MAG: hypothetical protein E7345_00860 [Clostridiales bacterium]|nr:hypothetical protein [Clostridiales bacterium]
MKDKLKTTSFWLELSGIIGLIVNAISGILDIKIYSDGIQDLVLAICAILISFGFVSKKKVSDSQNSSTEELLDDIKKDNK